jgi:hypothetical protein
MPSLYEAMNSALQSHWKQHQNQYPRFILSPEDHAALMHEIAVVREVFGPSALEFPRDQYHGAPIELRPGAAPTVVALDGSETLLEL